MNAFGKILREYREDKGVSLAKFALSIGYTAAHVSGVERGFKPVTETFFDKVVIYFNLGKEQQEELQKLADETQTRVVFKLDNADAEVRHMISTLRRKIDEKSLSYDTTMFLLMGLEDIIEYDVIGENDAR